MSTVRTDFGVTFDVHVGVTKTLEFTIIDPDTGSAKDLTDTAIYATGTVQIFKPDGTQIGTDMTVTYTTRASGIVQFTVIDTSHTLAANAGNWYGIIELSNTTPKVVEKQKFNINIIE